MAGGLINCSVSNATQPEKAGKGLQLATRASRLGVYASSPSRLGVYGV